ncbi:unnamed protein product [Peniophora sp. CBMAI 1063]|nr:unnamed protein product [Peniophora sp. CBMAI 1063]
MEVPFDGQPEYTDVLVVGAGPSGLMCALALARYGVDTMIVERREYGQIYGNADVIQPGTIELWESLGLREGLMREGTPILAYASWSVDEDSGELERQPQGPNVSLRDCRYPYEIALPIENIEGLLRDDAAKYRLQVEQPWIPTDLVILPEEVGKPNAYTVRVILERPADSKWTQRKRTIYAKYVVGCDGARSWVREKVGIKLERRERDDQAVNWGVLTFTPETDFPDTMVKAVISTPDRGMIFWIPRPDSKARLYVPLSSKVDTRTTSRAAFLDAISNVVDHVFRPYTLKIKDCDWISTYKVIQAVASSFSAKNRVFIAGDAGHTHSAKTGQGANAAMKDSFNLAWKLAFVIRGWAKPTLLVTYEAERKKYASDLIAIDRDIATAISHGRNNARFYKKIWEERNRFITGVGVCYHSPLTPVEKPSPLAPRLTPGERLPPAAILRLSDWRPRNTHDLLQADCTFKLLLFPGEMRYSVTMVDSFVSTLFKELRSWTAPEREVLKLFAIFSDLKLWSHWTEAPESVRDPMSVYVDDSMVPDVADMELSTTGVYSLYDIQPEGCAVLIRPDAHISLVSPINVLGAQEIARFLVRL